MNDYTQEGRPLVIETPLGRDKLLLIGISGHEAISQLFSFQLETLAVNADKISFDQFFDQLLGQPVTVELELPDNKNKRYFNGIVIRVVEGNRDEIFTEYTLEIVPKLWLLTRKAQSRIFQHKSVPDILREVLKGVKELDFNDEGIKGTFHPRDFCVQYRETDFNFASRMMEEEGIYYFFEHSMKESTGTHTMVLANTPMSHADVPGVAKTIYETVTGGEREEDRVYSWVKAQELRSGKVKLRDHCFELPHNRLDADKSIVESVQVGTVGHKLKVANNQELEIYDFPGEYEQRFDGVDKGGGEQPPELQKIKEDGQRTVDIRMQEEALPSLLVQGASNCRQFTSGHKFGLDRHFNANGQYVLTSVQHSGRQDHYRSEGEPFSYSNTFTCIPFALPFRPPRLTPKPAVLGTQTAVVVGPKGEEIFTDKYGRVKVQFHWDREGKSNVESSCWIRVAQVWAGKRWGASFWPRIGQEVIVDFLEGDPDQPIIVGSVYNADQMPPYLGGGSDSKHKKDNKVSGIKTNSTPGGEGYNELRFDDAKGKEQVFIHAQRNMDIRIKNTERKTVGGNVHLLVGFEDQAGEAHGSVKEKIFDTRSTHAKNIVLEAGGEICLTCGPSFIKLTPAGIWIAGPMVYMNSGGQSTAASGPDAADNSKTGYSSCK